jgi:hypothetical protein
MYFLNNEEFKSNLVPVGDCWKLAGEWVMNFNFSPYADITEDFDLLSKIEILPKVFLKATIITFPEYSKNVYENRRELGIYHYGKAKAELTPADNKPYFLKIETSSWEGIRDMKILQEKLWAGTIIPDVSYEKKQRRFHQLEIIARFLNSQHFNLIQRFVLALRLTRSVSIK